MITASLWTMDSKIPEAKWMCPQWSCWASDPAIDMVTILVSCISLLPMIAFTNDKCLILLLFRGKIDIETASATEIWVVINHSLM